MHRSGIFIGWALAASCTPSQPLPAVQAAPAPRLSTPGAPTAIAPPRRRPPLAVSKPVVDEYQGVAVSDPYRWLENGADPEVQKWSDAQHAFSRAVLDAAPDRAAIAARVTELLSATSATHFALRQRAGRWFALERRPPSQQPFLVLMKSVDDVSHERVIVDPARLDASGKTHIDFYEPSLDGKRVAVSLSSAGSEAGDVHVFDVETGQETGDVIAHVNGGTAGGGVAWSADGRQLLYTRYPRPGEHPAADFEFYQQIWSHELGAPAERDRYSFGKDFPRIAETDLETSRDGKQVLARVAHGDGGDFEHFLRDATGAWKNVAKLSDKVVNAHFGADGALYVVSRAGAPRGKLLRVVRESRVEVVPQSDAVLEDFVVTRSRVYVVELAGGPSRLRVYDLRGQPLGEVPTLPISDVSDLAPLGDDDLLFGNESYVEPKAFYRYDAQTDKTAKTSLFQTSPADFSDVLVSRDSCRSKDGTQIPMTLLSLKTSDQAGPRPTLLNGYGGYSISLTPRFRAIDRLWLDQGGVLVTANLRGGGEYGEAWHLAGNLTKKQNVFDDFAACMTRLVDTHVTSAGQLAIIGGSNGGLLMGAEIVQHPAAFRAVVSRVGIYDMLRVETTPNGVFNTSEFGTVRDPAQFRALYAYSPYHHVRDGEAYPATLLMTGKNDPRVDPYNSRKMAARLQAATSSSAPILLRTSSDTGHGGSSPLRAQIAESTDIYAFLLQQLGLRFRAR